MITPSREIIQNCVMVDFGPGQPTRLLVHAPNQSLVPKCDQWLSGMYSAGWLTRPPQSIKTAETIGQPAKRHHGHGTRSGANALEMMERGFIAELSPAAVDTITQQYPRLKKAQHTLAAGQSVEDVAKQWMLRQARAMEH